MYYPMPRDFEHHYSDHIIRGYTLLIQPYQMVIEDGYPDAGGWHYSGNNGLYINRACMWVTVGEQENLAGVIAACKEYEASYKKDIGAEIASGLYREYIKRTFKRDMFPRGFADPSWTDSNGKEMFPCILPAGSKSSRPGFLGEIYGTEFYPADQPLSGDWRWLMEVDILNDMYR